MIICGVGKNYFKIQFFFFSLCPSVVTLPKPKSSKDDEKHSIVTVNTNDTEIPEAEAEISTSACQFR